MISGGLYLGFDHSLTIVYMLIGGFCALYGPLLFIFKRRERPKWSSKRPLSRDFISVGSSAIMPVVKDDAEAERAAEQRTMDAGVR
jgi:hypothetical protein